MKKSKKILISVIIILAVLLIITAIVGVLHYKWSRTITDAEAREVLEELVPKSKEINEIIWGAGLPVEPGQDPALNTITAAQYRSVAKDCPYRTTEELKAAIAEVYSGSYIKNAINYICFDGADDALENTEAQMYPRYKDNDRGELIIDITNKGFALTTEIDVSTVKVVSAWRNKQNLEVESNIGTIKLAIVKQGSVWRLDSPTY